MGNALDQVDYDVLDRAKAAFIAASRKTLRFAEQYGFVLDERLGSSANVFALDLQPFLKSEAEKVYVTLLPEGLGTADDARPDDLTAEESRRFWFNIGIKTVAVMTNDAASSGMQTILIALYLPSSTPELVFNADFMEGFLDGFVEGCRTVGCVYFSGETPQLKNKIYPDKLDIAGALFGVLPAGVKPIDSTRIQPGDKIVFVESSGPHENGFTALRELAGKLPQGYRTQLPSGTAYWEGINKGSKLYTPFVQDLLQSGIQPSNVENITGHGWQKLMRSKQPLRYVIHQMLPVPEVFSFVQERSGSSVKRMLEIFNYGVGLAVFVRSHENAEQVIELAQRNDLQAVIAGDVQESKQREVVVEPLDVILGGEKFLLQK